MPLLNLFSSAKQPDEPALSQMLRSFSKLLATELSKPERYLDPLVEGAQLALGFTGRCPHALGGALRASECDTGEGEPPEQMVPVTMRGEQTARGREAGLLEQRWQRIELIGQDRGIDHKRLSHPIDRPADDHAVDLENRAGGDEYVRVQGDRPHVLR